MRRDSIGPFADPASVLRMPAAMAQPAVFPRIPIAPTAPVLRGVVVRTPLEPFESGDPRLDLRLKLECLQETGSFKARGAWNQIHHLDAEACSRGVTATSSGNHGRALAWAARRAGIRATIVMPEDAYPNKIAACRELGAEVVLGRDRTEAEALCAALVEGGATLIHPYDSERTIQGAGTVGLEIAEDWDAVEVVVVPVGGGGLLAGSSLALRELLGDQVVVIGAEPAGAPTMSRALAAGEPVEIEAITTVVQGLCPLSAGALNTAVCTRTVRAVLTLTDAQILAAQARLVRAGWTVEPAGAAATAAVLTDDFFAALPPEFARDRGPDNPLRVAAIVSGGNPAPGQVEGLLVQS